MCLQGVSARHTLTLSGRAASSSQMYDTTARNAECLNQAGGQALLKLRTEAVSLQGYGLQAQDLPGVVVSAQAYAGYTVCAPSRSA